MLKKIAVYALAHAHEVIDIIVPCPDYAENI